MVQTPYERGGNLTTREEEKDFLETLASEHSGRYEVIGRSVLGRPMWKFELGNPSGKSFFVNCGIHASEMMARETGIRFIRDLVESENSAIQGFLSTYRVVVVPTASPDGSFVEGRSRTNAEDVNLGSDWLRLSSPENRYLGQLIRDIDPLVIIDVHEWANSDTSATFAYRHCPSDLEGHYPDIEDPAYDLVEHGLEEVEQHGYGTIQYNSRASNPTYSGTLTRMGYLLNIPTILTETIQARARSARLDSAAIFIMSALEWVSGNTTRLENSIASLVSKKTGGTAPLPIHTGSGEWGVVSDPGAYDVGAVSEGILSAYGIEVESGQVSTAQAARSVLPTIFDSNSRDYHQNFSLTRQFPISGEVSLVPHSLGGAGVSEMVIMKDGERSLVSSIRHGF